MRAQAEPDHPFLIVGAGRLCDRQGQDAQQGRQADPVSLHGFVSFSAGPPRFPPEHGARCQNAPGGIRMRRPSARIRRSAPDLGREGTLWEDP